MNDIDCSRSDREVGSVLSGEEVERLREAIGWLRGQRGVRLKDIALGCDAAEHTVRNFAYRKSIRPDNAFLGKLSKFIAGRKELLPDDFFANGKEARPTPACLAWAKKRGLICHRSNEASSPQRNGNNRLEENPGIQEKRFRLPSGKDTSP